MESLETLTKDKVGTSEMVAVVRQLEWHSCFFSNSMIMLNFVFSYLFCITDSHESEAVRATVALMPARGRGFRRLVGSRSQTSGQRPQPREVQHNLKQQASQAREQEALEPLTVLCEVLCCLIFVVSVIF